MALALFSAVAQAQTAAPASLNREARKDVAAAAAPSASPKAPKKEGVKSELAKPTEPITTEIYADAAQFDSTKYVGVFNGHVIVRDPRFNVTSDKLTVFLHKNEDENGGGKGEESQAEGLEKAIAEGNVGIVRDKPDPNGGPPQRSIGRSDKAVYTTSDGKVQMTGSPRVQQGMNNHVATSVDTIMIMDQDGHLETRGPSRTEIRQEPKATPTPTPAGATPTATATAKPSATPKP